MNKDEWILKVTKGLSNMSQEEIAEITADYREYFQDAIDNGRTEEEVIRSLGNPRKVSKELKASSNIKRAEENMNLINISRAVFSVVTLGIFNLTVMFSPTLLLFLLIFIFALLGLIIGATGLFLLALGILGIFSIFPLTLSAKPIVLTLAGLMIGSLGGIIFVCSSMLAQKVFKLLVKYFRFNMKIIKGDRL